MEQRSGTFRHKNSTGLYSKNENVFYLIKGKTVQLHAMEGLGGRGGIAPTHSRPRH
jgi:hypothetical protein